jgi:hypothetical protein
MKIHRVTIRNYRGVEDSTVEFADTGVTVIVGDNEVGKSSLIEAIELIFEYQHNSTAQIVRAVKPVDKDVGAEVELDVSMGPYRFTYKKRFNRDHLTELHIQKPTPQNLTGREAHDRVNQILGETTDVDLFWALRLQQGVALEQADVSDDGTLGAALDRAAGREVAGDVEHSLYGRVENEYTKYWTMRGQPNSEFRSYGEGKEKVQLEVDQLSSELKTLDELVQSAESSLNEIGALEPRLSEQQTLVLELEQARNTVLHKERDVGQLSMQNELKASEFSRAKDNAHTRANLKAVVEHEESALERLRSDQENLTPSLEAAQNAFDETDRLWSEVKAKADEAASLAKVREDDFDHQRNLFDLVTMEERRDRILDAKQQLQQAEAFLADCNISDKELEAIEEAQTTLFRAEAALAGEGAQLNFISRGVLDLEINGVIQNLAPGDEVREIITEPFLLRIPDVADIAINPGTSSLPSRTNFEEATAQLNAKLADSGVKSLEEARKLNRERASTEEILSHAEDGIERDCRDLTFDQLQGRLQALKSKASTYATERSATEPMPDNFDEAQEWRGAARQKHKQGVTEVTESEGERSSAEEVLRQMKEKEREVELQQRSAEGKLSGARSALIEARDAIADVALQALLLQAQQDASTAKELHATESKALEVLNPEGILAEYETAVGVEKRMRENLEEIRLEFRDTGTRLLVKGEEGLQSKHDHAQSQLEHASSVYERVSERAQAVRLLNEIMTRHRDQARSEYLTPLTEKIVSLGKIVFGPTFSVEVGDDLRISRRTLSGKTIDFKELSTGAREQLGILSRLACASIAAEDGGVPFILDDALGWSDPTRLQRIGAALTVGSRDCQVIALTCTPGRYEQVDAKKIISLP